MMGNSCAEGSDAPHAGRLLPWRSLVGAPREAGPPRLAIGGHEVGRLYAALCRYAADRCRSTSSPAMVVPGEMLVIRARGGEFSASCAVGDALLTSLLQAAVLRCLGGARG